MSLMSTVLIHPGQIFYRDIFTSGDSFSKHDLNVNIAWISNQAGCYTSDVITHHNRDCGLTQPKLKLGIGE